MFGGKGLWRFPGAALVLRLYARWMHIAATSRFHGRFGSFQSGSQLAESMILLIV
jgi:hypothetical protein